MRVGIVSVQVPFIRGGAELLAEACKKAMLARNIQAEIITIPFKWYPPEKIIDHIKIAKLMDITEANGMKIDKAICLKFPAYFCQHPNKSLWLLHQHRQAYDLYDSSFSDLKLSKQGIKVAKKISELDNKFIPEHRRIFTISKHIANKLKFYNQIQANEVLYPPPNNQDAFTCGQYDDYILYPSRFCETKRQELIVRAMQLVPSGLKLILLGSYQNTYGSFITDLIQKLNLQDRIILKNYVTEQEKIDLYANCLAVYNGVYDEDYGYVTIEAFLSAKAVIAHDDSGGPLEFIENDLNGFIIEPNPIAIANTLKRLYLNKKEAIQYGRQGLESLASKNLSWDYIIEKLLS
jgi:glycosyltransferase involved in cell wall biosynthesis